MFSANGNRGRRGSAVLPSHHTGQRTQRKPGNRRLAAVSKLLLFCVVSAALLWLGKKAIWRVTSQKAPARARGLAEQAAAQPKEAPCTEETCTHPHHTADVAARAQGTGHLSVGNLQRAGAATGLYAMDVTDTDGQVYKLDKYAGKVSLVVNVASQCGYTESNYVGLQKLYDQYQSRGFEILAFPCNGFGQQEPGTLAEILAFAHDQYHATFPIFPKVEVNGPDEHAIFGFLKRSLPDQKGVDISWNFNKFLVNRSGMPVKHYASTFNEQELAKEIEAELAGPNHASHAHASAK